MEPAGVRNLPRLAAARAARAPGEAVADRIIAVGIRLALAAVAVQTILHLVNAFTLEGALLDVNQEQSLSAWLTSLAIFSAALGCLLLATAGNRAARTCVSLAALLMFFSLDEALAVHERVGLRAVDLVGVSVTWDSVLWPIVYLPLMGAVLVGLLVVGRAAPRRIRRLIVAGLGCLAAAVAAEVVSAPFASGENLVHVLEGAAEEGLELEGWALIAAALFALSSLLPRAAPPQEGAPLSRG